MLTVILDLILVLVMILIPSLPTPALVLSLCFVAWVGLDPRVSAYFDRLQGKLTAGWHNDKGAGS